MSFYSLIIGDTLDNLFSKYAWRFLLLTVGIFFLLDFILAFLKEFEDLSDFYTIDKILHILSYSSPNFFCHALDPKSKPVQLKRMLII